MSNGENRGASGLPDMNRLGERPAPGRSRLVYYHYEALWAYEKFSFSPGRGHSNEISLPVEDSVT